MQQKTGSFKEKFSKNTFYRFMNNAKTNWLRFTSLLSKAVADTIEPLTGPKEHYDGRSLAAKRRNLAQTKGTEVMLQLLKQAKNAGHHADYVLFDTWFSNPSQLLAVKELGLDSIAMIKKSARIYYECKTRIQ